MVNHQVSFAYVQRILFYEILKVACLVAIRTWLIAKSFLLFSSRIFIHRYLRYRISRVGKTVTSLSCWGRVVIGSLFVYQTSGAGSNPVASTTVLTVSARPIGNGQKIWISFAWEGLERSRPFLIPAAYRETFLYFHLYRTTKVIASLSIC